MTTRRPLTWILDTVALVALGVPVIRYALAFQTAEPPLNVWGYHLDVSPITGPLFGLTYEYAVYLGIREAFRARRDGLKRWWLPLCGAGVQILAGIGIVAPVVEATQSGRSLSAVLGAWSWPWSVVLTGATVLTLVTLAITRALRKDDAPHAPQFENAPCNEKAAPEHTKTGNGNGHNADWRNLALRLRNEHPDWTQRRIAEACGVDASRVSRVFTPRKEAGNV